MSGSDSEGSLDPNGWAVVKRETNEQFGGEESASSSGSEFVHVHHSQVSYHNRQRTEDDLPENQQISGVINALPDTASLLDPCQVTQEEAEFLNMEDEIPEAEMLESELMEAEGDTYRNSEHRPSVDYAADGEDEDDHSEDSGSVSSIEVLEASPLGDSDPEILTFRPQGLNDSTEGPRQDAESQEEPFMEQVISSSSIEALPMPSDDEGEKVTGQAHPYKGAEPTDDQDKPVLENIGASAAGSIMPPAHKSKFHSRRPGRPASTVRQESTDSESSDFLHLQSPSHHASGEEVMRLSTSSHSSDGSFVSGGFRFVHQGRGYPYPHDVALARLKRAQSETHAHRQYYDDDLASLPSDVDDRCESDISGIVADDSDLSHRSLGDVPIAVGNVVRSYRHRPNVSLNTTLTVMALVALFMAVGIGIGHYIGSVRELTLRQAQIAKMKSLQDDFLICLQDQDRLNTRLKTPTLKEQKLSAVVEIWQHKYEELVLEKAELEQHIHTLEGVMDTDLQAANIKLQSHHLEASQISTDLQQLRQEYMDLEDALAGEKLRANTLQTQVNVLSLTRSVCPQASPSDTRLGASSQLTVPATTQTSSGSLPLQQDAIPTKTKQASKEPSMEPTGSDEASVVHTRIEYLEPTASHEPSMEPIGSHEQSVVTTRPENLEPTTSLEPSMVPIGSHEPSVVTTWPENVVPTTSHEPSIAPTGSHEQASVEYPMESIESLRREIDMLQGQLEKLRQESSERCELGGHCYTSEELQVKLGRLRYGQPRQATVTQPVLEAGHESKASNILADQDQLLDLEHRLEVIYNDSKSFLTEGQPEVDRRFMQCWLLLVGIDIMETPKKPVFYRDFCHNVARISYLVENQTQHQQNGSQSADDIAKWKNIMQDVMGQLQKHWTDLVEHDKVVAMKDKVKETLNNLKDSASKVKASDQVQRMVNATKSTVAQVSQKVQDSLHKAQDLLSSQERLQKIKTSVTDNMSSITKNLKEGLRRVQDSLSHKLWSHKPKGSCTGRFCSPAKRSGEQSRKQAGDTSGKQARERKRGKQEAGKVRDRKKKKVPTATLR